MGVLDVSGKIPNVVKTLKQAGYRTGMIGKLHIKPKDAFPFDFKAIPSSNFARKDMAAYLKHAGAFMRAGGQPFYLQVNFPDAHRPFIKQVDQIPARPLTGKEVQALPYMGINHSELRQQTADYYNCMMRLDTYIGQLLAVLEQSVARGHGSGVHRRSWCGYAARQADLLRGWPEGADDYSLAEQSARPASGGTGETLDLYPTFCDIAGARIPDTLAGRSLKPLVHGQQPAWRQYLFTEFHVHSNHNPWPQRTVRDARFKLIYNPVAGEENLGYAFTSGKILCRAGSGTARRGHRSGTRGLCADEKTAPLRVVRSEGGPV